MKLFICSVHYKVAIIFADYMFSSIYGQLYKRFFKMAKFVSMLRFRIVSVACCVMFSLLVTGALPVWGSSFDFSRFKAAHKDDSLNELLADGYNCIRNVQADSAIAYYTMAISNYSETLPYEDLRRCAIAYINCGYVYLAYKQDAEQAYLQIGKGVEIAEKNGMYDLCSAGYDNLAKIYDDYGDEAKALSLHKKAFRFSVRSKCYPAMLSVVPDLATFAFSHHLLDSVAGELKTFISLAVPDNLLMARYCKHLCEGMMRLRENDFDSAVSSFRMAIETIDSKSERPRREVNVLLLIADVYSMKSSYKEGLPCLERAERLSIENGMFDLLDDVYRRYVTCYSALGNSELSDYYEREALVIRDSLFNARQFGMIKDLEFAHSVHEFNDEMLQMREEAERDALVMRVLLASVTCALALLLWVFIKKRQLAKSYKDLFRKNVEAIQSKDKETEISRASKKTIDGYGVMQEQTSDAKEERYKGSVLDDGLKDDLLARILHVFESSPVIFDVDFSLDRLSELTGSKPKYVSQVINEKTGKNFNLLLGEYRVKEACRRLLDIEKYGNLTIGAISESVGYRSRTHFSSIFKKETGLTPAEFSRQARKKGK